MSGRRKVGDGDVEVMVIRSSDGKKANVSSYYFVEEHCFSLLLHIKSLNQMHCICLTTQIDISLSSTLNVLKDAISTKFGPMKRTEQRLFYLGRELKSENRTLSGLGIGNFNVFSIHLHSLAPQMVDLLGDDQGDMKQKSSSSVSTNRRKKNNASTDGGFVDLASSSSSSSGQRRSRQQQQQNQQQGQEKVVELLDSDSDSDDDIVEVVDTKRQRRD